MTSSLLDTTALQELDHDHGQLLDIIDNLRQLKLQSLLELPQIIVVGDQSAGKSSVLEAISKVKFPAKSGICTRFATELIIRKSTVTRTDVEIIAEDQELLQTWVCDDIQLDSRGFEKILDQAKDYLGLKGTGFSERVLRIQIQAPNLPRLSLVDLPGIYHAGTSEQKREGKKIVTNLANKYMKQKRSIILAVVSAKSELANQKVLDLTKRHDPRRERTLGIITKPDTLEPGSKDEQRYIQLARNEEPAHRLDLGWHVLRNRNETEKSTTDEERDLEEEAFFDTGAWVGLSPSNKGIAALRPKLRAVGYNHLRENLPGVMANIKTLITEKNIQLEKLGQDRSAEDAQRVYLVHIAQSMERLARDAISGRYSDGSFFGNLSDNLDSNTCVKLRTCIRLLNQAFAGVMAVKGCTRFILEPDGSRAAPAATKMHESSAALQHSFEFDHPETVEWDELARELGKSAVEQMGTEFPGSMNSALVFGLFKAQAARWEAIARRHLELGMTFARTFVDTLLRHVVGDAYTRSRIMAEYVEPFFEQRNVELEAKLKELLEHHQGDYPVQLDGEFEQRLLRRRVARVKMQGEDRASKRGTFGMNEAIDTMQTYYEMSLHTFTENVIVLAAENCLIRKIPSIFEPLLVVKMTSEQLADVAAEKESIRNERAQLKADLDKLKRGHQECRRYRSMETPPAATELPAVSPASRITLAPVTPNRRATTSRPSISRTSSPDRTPSLAVSPAGSARSASTLATPEPASLLGAGLSTRKTSSETMKKTVVVEGPELLAHSNFEGENEEEDS